MTRCPHSVRSAHRLILQRHPLAHHHHHHRVLHSCGTHALRTLQQWWYRLTNTDADSRETPEFARRTVRRSCATPCEPLGSQLTGARGAPHVSPIPSTSTRQEMSVLAKTRTSSPMRSGAARSRVGVFSPWSPSGEATCVVCDVILAGPQNCIP